MIAKHISKLHAHINDKRESAKKLTLVIVLLAILSLVHHFVSLITLPIINGVYTCTKSNNRKKERKKSNRRTNQMIFEDQ